MQVENLVSSRNVKDKGDPEGDSPEDQLQDMDFEISPGNEPNDLDDLFCLHKML